MKRILFSLFIGCTLTVFGQSLNLLTIEQLETKKEDAIKNENFDLAQRIKSELDSRKTTTQLKIDTEKKMKVAVSKEDFEQASVLKRKLEQINELEELENKIKQAVEKEDFQAAKSLKESKNKLYKDLVDSADIKVVNEFDNKNTSGESFIVFESIYPMDVFINEKYIGSIRKNVVLKVTMNPGSYDFRFVYGFLGNPSSTKAKDKLSISGTEKVGVGKVYTYSMVDLFPPQNIKKGIAKYVISEQKEISNDFEVINQDYDNPVFSPRPLEKAISSYMKLTTVPSLYKSGLPEGTDASFFTFNIKEDYSTPISKSNGLVAGFSFSTYIMQMRIRHNAISSTESSALSFGFQGLLGYQIELDQFTIQPNIIWGPSFSMTSINGPGVVGGGENDFSFGGTFNLSGMVFFNKSHSFGLVGEGNFGFEGGSSFSAGVVLGKIKKPRYRHLDVGF